MKFGVSLIIMGLALGLSGCQNAPNNETALIAVSTNFRTTFETLETVFETQTDFNVTQVSGATGSLYTQITNGAPYHVFLSADEVRPQMLEQDGLASGRFTYAIGELVIWSRSDEILDAPLEEILTSSKFGPLSMANPALAPYGRAAQEVLGHVSDQINERLVMGENVGQSFALVSSNNARTGFVAKSDALRSKNGYKLEIDKALYSPIKQDAVILGAGENLAAAKAFFSFLQSQDARDIILADGYSLPKGDL